MIRGNPRTLWRWFAVLALIPLAGAFGLGQMEGFAAGLVSVGFALYAFYLYDNAFEDES